jgi:glucosamine--fructose-6-phosphate aminotransferase (isomerizing)
MTGADVLLAEIAEQPDVLGLILADGSIPELARRLAVDPPALVRFAAHGSSDNAATYGVYAFGRLAGRTAVRDSISLPVYDGVRLGRRGELAIALSQSGETPDVVAWLEAMAEAGATTVAITNAPDSPLASAASAVIGLEAGEERSVAATKTYTAELAVLARLAAHAGDRGAELDEALAATIELARRAIAELPDKVKPVAEALAWAERLMVTGRGPEFATAREIALKLTELCRLGGVAMTATDLAHGPIAALDERFPVWVSVGRDSSLEAVREAVDRIAGSGAPLVAAGPGAGELRARHAIELPAAPDPLLSPLLSVLPGQLFAAALAAAKRLDAGAPRNLRKVTRAR